MPSDSPIYKPVSLALGGLIVQVTPDVALIQNPEGVRPSVQKFLFLRVKRVPSALLSLSLSLTPLREADDGSLTFRLVSFER